MLSDKTPFFTSVDPCALPDLHSLVDLRVMTDLYGGPEALDVAVGAEVGDSSSKQPGHDTHLEEEIVSEAHRTRKRRGVANKFQWMKASEHRNKNSCPGARCGNGDPGPREVLESFPAQGRRPQAGNDSSMARGPGSPFPH